MEIKMVDLSTQYLRLKESIDAGMQNVIESTAFINGPAVHLFKKHLANYLGVKHVIPCANGTDALQAALMALDLRPGDEVITSTFTFVATVEVIVLLGLKPVFVDVDPHSFNLVPKLVKKAVTSRTKVIIPVHLFGQGGNMEAILDVAEEFQLFVVEDAAQCIGADYFLSVGKRKLGTIGDVGCTSFFPSKNLGCFGDGGACFTNDDALAKKLLMIVNHGAERKYFHEVVGLNSRLDALQAAVLDVKLKSLDDFNHRRSQAAHFYDEALGHLDGVELPFRQEKSDHVFHQYTLKVKSGQRDALKGYLAQKGIPTMVYYPVPVHKQVAYYDFVGNGNTFPVAESLSNTVLSLPMHTELDTEQLKFITDSVIGFFSKTKE